MRWFLATALAGTATVSTAAGADDHVERDAPTQVDIDGAMRSYAHEPSVHEMVLRAVARTRAASRELASIRTRSRLSGWVPTVRVLVRRGRGQGSLIRDSQTPYSNFSADDDFSVSGQLGFRLDRLVFAPEEIAVAREVRMLRDGRSKLVQAIVRLYFERRRLQLERDLLGQRSVKRSTRLGEIEALLERYTGVRLSSAAARAHSANASDLEERPVADRMRDP